MVTMFRRLVLGLICVVSFSLIGQHHPILLATTPQAQTPPPAPPKTIYVFVTKTGKKYHRGSCQHLAKSSIKLSLTDAQSRGYEACKTCRPPLKQPTK
jgi:hypothetical protein